MQTVETQPAGAESPSTKTLYTALLAAQQAIQSVAHDATNAFHKYDYVSAEAMIAEARRVLLACGLLLVRSHPTIETTSLGHMLVAVYSLVHPESGGELRDVSRFPIVPEKGRPLDKAFATALTTALKYWLRDLLLLPRVVADDDMDTRDDRESPGVVKKHSARPTGQGGYQPRLNTSHSLPTQPQDVQTAVQQQKAEHNLLKPSPVSLPTSSVAGGGLADKQREIGQMIWAIAGQDKERARALCRELTGTSDVLKIPDIDTAMDEVHAAYQDWAGAEDAAANEDASTHVDGRTDVTVL